MSDEPTVIHVESMVASRDRKPYVVLKWGEESGQMTPTEALEHAGKIVEAAQAAITDSFLVAFVVDKVGADPDAALGILLEFRGFRMALERQTKG